MNRLGIESLTTFWLPPVDLVGLTADLGCDFVAVPLSPFSANPEGFAPWSLRDPVTRREMKAAMTDRGVAIGLAQGFGIFPGRDVADKAADLDIFCELGIHAISGVTMDTDFERSVDQLGRLVEMAGAVGVEVMLEFVPTRAIPDLAAALRARDRIGAGNVKLMIDTMHLVRSGGGPADVAALASGVIGYVQLCDVPLAPSMPDYLEEAVAERLPPGAGQLPLAEILAAVPDDVPIALEIPMLSRAQAGEGPRERARRCVDGARRLIAA